MKTPTQTIHRYRSESGAEYLAKSPGGPPLRYITQSQALKKLAQLRAQGIIGTVVKIGARWLIELESAITRSVEVFGRLSSAARKATKAISDFNTAFRSAPRTTNLFATPPGFPRINPRNRHNHPQHNPPVEPRYIFS